MPAHGVCSTHKGAGFCSAHALGKNIDIDTSCAQCSLLRSTQYAILWMEVVNSIHVHVHVVLFC